MKEKYVIREYRKEDYEISLRLLFQLLNNIFSPFNRFSMEKNISFFRDVDAFPKEGVEGMFVCTLKNEVVGIIMLRFQGQKDYKSKPVLTIKEIGKKYGFFKTRVSKAIIASIAHNVEEDELYLDYIVVDENHRGNGIGKILLDHGLEFAKRKKMYRYTLGVMSNNVGAKKLYELYGFNVVKRNKNPGFVKRRLSAEFDYKMEKKVFL